jgi:hypothetical protein
MNPTHLMTMDGSLRQMMNRISVLTRDWLMTTVPRGNGRTFSDERNTSRRVGKKPSSILDFSAPRILSMAMLMNLLDLVMCPGIHLLILAKVLRFRCRYLRLSDPLKVLADHNSHLSRLSLCLLLTLSIMMLGEVLLWRSSMARTRHVQALLLFSMLPVNTLQVRIQADSMMQGTQHFLEQSHTFQEDLNP